jgi:hypothetical protein
MDRNFGPVLRGVQSATSFKTDLAADVDKLLRNQ